METQPGRPLVLTGLFEVQFIALQNSLVPRSKTLTPEQKQISLNIINEFLSEKSKFDHFRFKLFLILIDLYSFGVGLSPFRLLSEAKKQAVLNHFFSSPIGLFRKGFWGVNTLAKMSVYSQNFIYKEINYERKPFTS